jgi:hypothetical protein
MAAEASHTRLDFGVSTPPPMPRLQPQRILSQALAPFQSITRTSPRAVRDTQRHRACTPLPRFFPLRRLLATRSHIPPAVPVAPVTLRPQGFSPSRRLAPLVAFRACSIPVPPMGFCPSRPLSSADAVRPLERRAPPGFLPEPRARGHPSRDSHVCQSPTAGLGFSQIAVPVAPLGFPAPRPKARDSEDRSHVLHPLSRFFDPVARSPNRRRPRVLAVTDVTVLPRDRSTPVRFSTSLAFSTLWRSRRVGIMDCPQRPTRVAAARILLFTLPSNHRPELVEMPCR